METWQPAMFWLALQSRMPRLARWLAWLRHEIIVGVVLAPLEPMLHASQWRLGWMGAVTLFGNLAFGWMWTYQLPQPWESMELRFVAASSGLLLLVMATQADSRAQKVQWVFNAVAFLNLPLFFSWMYLCNGGNRAWLASAVAMVLIYYQLVDWRIATIGMVLGVIVANILFVLFGLNVVVPAGVDAYINEAVLGFAWAVAIVLGFSTANQRRLRLRRTLTTIGIVAHELRTPLATVALISQALRTIASDPAAQGSGSVEPLADKLSAVVRSMNHQIDMQVTNARQLHLNSSGERIGAVGLVTELLLSFPFRTSQERDSVQMEVKQDFSFVSSRMLFIQVLSNLLTNAQRALAATDVPLGAGSIVIGIKVEKGRGLLTVTDQGIGISSEMKERIFEPFFTGDNHTGNGLGLAFCKRAVKSASGSIRVHSQPGRGASFVIELPLLHPS